MSDGFPRPGQHMATWAETKALYEAYRKELSTAGNLFQQADSEVRQAEVNRKAKIETVRQQTESELSAWSDRRASLDRDFSRIADLLQRYGTPVPKSAEHEKARSWKAAKSAFDRAVAIADAAINEEWQHNMGRK